MSVKTKANSTRKKERGRPIKLNDELQELICNYIRAGNYVETAAAAAGIHKTTLYDWLKKGANNKSGKFKEFADAVNVAVAQSEVRDLSIIEESAKQGNWQSAAWRLERRFPSKWGKKDRLDANVNSEHTEKEELVIERRLTADDESRELLRQLYRRHAAMAKEGE